MTTRRLIVAAAASLTIAAALIWPHEKVASNAIPQTIGAGKAEPLEVEIARLRTYQGIASRKLRALSLRDSIVASGARLGGDSMLRVTLVGSGGTEVDPRVFAGKVTEELRKAGTAEAKVPLDVFIKIERASGDSTATSPPRVPTGWDVVYNTPSPGTNGPCRVVVRIVRDSSATGSNDALIRALKGQLLGPCAFYASFGQPGSAISSWLQAREYDVASFADTAYEWKRSWYDEAYRRPFYHPIYLLARQRLLKLGRVGGRDEYFPFSLDLAVALQNCLDGRSAACEDLALDPALIVPDALTARPSDLETVQNGRVSLSLSSRVSISSLPWDVVSMKSLLNEMLVVEGRDRFSKFWQSSAQPADAFANATGSQLGEWIKEHLPYYARRGSTVPPLIIGIAAAYILVCLGLTLRTGIRREVR